MNEEELMTILGAMGKRILALETSKKILEASNKRLVEFDNKLLSSTRIPKAVRDAFKNGIFGDQEIETDPTTVTGVTVVTNISPLQTAVVAKKPDIYLKVTIDGDEYYFGGYNSV